MKVAALFAGVGGIELGLHRAGHETIFFCESDPGARAVLEERFNAEKVSDGAATPLDSEGNRNTADRSPRIPIHPDITTLDRLPADTELVTVGFPCQDLSQAGRTKGLDGKKSTLVSHLFRLLNRTEVPRVLVENVPFMLRLNKGAAIEYLTREFEGLGYSWAYRIIDSRAFGLAQRRKRAFLLASRVDSPAAVLYTDDRPPPEALSTRVGRGTLLDGRKPRARLGSRLPPDSQGWVGPEDTVSASDLVPRRSN